MHSTRVVMPRMLLLLAILGPWVFAEAQQVPIRQIGHLERVTPDSLAFASVTTALAMPGGHVMINDVRGRRVLLLDSTLTKPVIVADTTPETANAYGTSWATLIRYRGDSALLLVPSTLSMFLIAPNGETNRTMAIPRPNEAQQLGGRTFGTPALDARGRLIYFGETLASSSLVMRRGTPWLEGGKPGEVARRIIARGGWASPTAQRSESASVVGTDLSTRLTDTVFWVRVPKTKREVKIDPNGLITGVEMTRDPLPVIDQWTILRDGTIAIVRGRDYHIAWVDRSGRVSSTPKMPFDWQRVDEARKTVLIDSALASWHAWPSDTTRGSRAGRGGVDYVRTAVVRAAPTDLPDYSPPFGEHSVVADWDGHVWISTTRIVDGRPVYDIVNRKGDVIDHVQSPPYRVIVGFGPGVIYMAMKDAGGIVHLERARIR